jgi:thiol-disulfide isomerase/thioredoxin
VKRSNSTKKITNKNRNRNRNAAAVKVIQVTKPEQLRAAEQLLGEGAGSLVLIWSPTCPHCHTYMPIWKELSKMSNKQTNMISIRSDMYSDSSLAEKQPVESVPTVLYVNSEGAIKEVEEARNKTVMANIIKTGTPVASESATESFPVPETPDAVEMPPATASSILPSEDVASVKPATNYTVTVPGTTVEPSKLNILPGQTSSELPEVPKTNQMGGNLNGFLQAAGPAALLLGAYAAFGRTRSSGLPPATRRRGRGRGRGRRVRFSRRHRRQA